eukprot:4607181-Amphidinium_carterae.1
MRAGTRSHFAGLAKESKPKPMAGHQMTPWPRTSKSWWYAPGNKWRMNSGASMVPLRSTSKDWTKYAYVDHH